VSEIKDWRGTPIEVGDVILYAVKHSTSVEVNEAIVKEVGRKAPSWLWREPREDDLKPYVTCEWQQSSYCYVPGRDHVASAGRAIKNVKLTNFEGITVVAKGTPPAWASKRHDLEWAKDANL